MPFPLRCSATRRTGPSPRRTARAWPSRTGELICFLNNDVDPITDDWLGYLVETLTTTGRGGGRGPSHLPAAPRRTEGRGRASTT